MSSKLNSFPTLQQIVHQVYKDKIACKKIVNGALDLNWAEEFQLFYNSQPKSAPYVKRVRFKKNKTGGKDAGFSDVRPRSDGSEVSETYLIPPIKMENEKKFDLKCLGTYDAYGQIVKCAPYIMPESIFGMCIHGSIWICLKILENLGMIEKSHPIPSIETLARGKPYADKQGLLFTQTSRIFRMCKTNALYIDNEVKPRLTDDQMALELYAYIESRLPVILGVDTKYVPWWSSQEYGYHSIVAIGHTMDDNGKPDGFIFHDESSFPYQDIKIDALMDAWHTAWKGNKKPKKPKREMIVAVPPEVSLPFNKAHPQFEQILELSRNYGYSHDSSNDLLVKPILKGAFETFMETKSESLYKAMVETKPTKYVWIFYLYDKEVNERNVETSKGFFVRDATAESELRFLYFKDTKQALYQKEDHVYLVRDDRKRKKKLI